MSMSSSLAYPELAAPSRVDPRWAFDGTTCIMPSGSCDGPISVQLWLEALKAELEGLFIDKGPDQGRILRQLVEGPLRAKLASKIAETPELQQAVQQREATFDHYAAALISCADPDDALASHYAASHPKRRAVRNFPRRWPAWSGPSARPRPMAASWPKLAASGPFMAS